MLRMNKLKCLITRMGKESKAILNGDPAQSDLYENQRGGFDFCMDRLTDVEGIAVCKLEGSDIVRNDIIARILNRLGE